MRISDLLSDGKPVFSFEFSPPKTVQGEQSLLSTIGDLRDLNPSFVSVTYGAGGSTREKTIDIVTRIKREYDIEAMAHLTCVGHDRVQIARVLDRLQASGIENLLALRGDPPRGEAAFVCPEGGFQYATELVHFIRQQGYQFCLSGAGYPEGHVECRDLEADIAHLQEKVQAGIDFVITQLFFDNADYFSFVDRARGHGINIPIIPGIMPITNVPQIERITELSGARIPTTLRQRMHAAEGDDEAVHEIGVEHATHQCRELLDSGAPGIHFFTLNRSPATAAILAKLRH